jgi:hypothetical protein
MCSLMSLSPWMYVCLDFLSWPAGPPPVRCCSPMENGSWTKRHHFLYVIKEISVEKWFLHEYYLVNLSKCSMILYWMLFNRASAYTANWKMSLKQWKHSVLFNLFHMVIKVQKWSYALSVFFNAYKKGLGTSFSNYLVHSWWWLKALINDLGRE